MRRLIAALLLLFAYDVAAEVRCSGSPCVDSSGGFSSPVTTDPVVFNGAATFDKAVTTSLGSATPSAGAANAVETGETAGCITLEGATADGFEARVCGGDSTVDGTVSLLAIPTTGFRVTTAAANINFAPAGYDVMSVEGAVTGSVRMRTGTFFGFTNGLPEGTIDAGLFRNGIGGGLTVVSSVAGAIGYIAAAQLTQPQITTYTTTGPESGGIYTNTGDADGATITLLNDPIAGIWYDFGVTVAQTFTIQPSAGETLYLGASTCATLASTVVGSIAHVVAITGGSGGQWMSQATGTWVCTP